MRRFLFALLVFAAAGNVFAQDMPPTPEQVEFFEKKIRPVLVQHCYECHSTKSKKVRGKLLLDSQAGLLRGGELGPAIVPGNPDKSRLIEAIRFTNVDLRMPRVGKLSDAVIADMTAWVKMGAPWPAETVVKKKDDRAFDLQKRKAEHWCWQPIRVPAAPKVNDATWAQNDIDRFLLAKLEAKGLKPAPDADARTLLRRVHFDIIGLPPSRTESDAFNLAWHRKPAERGELLAKVVDRLLASPQYGERWARHWLDLVRYAESRGHEFDYTIPNAHQYRDYVIRAINSDVPYNQFVKEHIAGDLLRDPRIGEDGADESILGTAFWFLGEEIHSPVDIRQDQADRFDNRIDVMTKTFLGLTVACARCHDHKFDAISTKDYYALFGILESSNYRLARFDTIARNRKIAEGLTELHQSHVQKLRQAMDVAAKPTVDKIDAYLYTAAGVEDRSKDLDPVLVKAWQRALAEGARDENSPLFAFAKLAADPKRPVREVLESLLKRWPATSLDLKGLDVVVDYRDAKTALIADDLAFGIRPARPGDVYLGTTPMRPIARVVEQGAAERNHVFDGMRLSPGAQNESGSLGSAMRPGRTMRTPEFTLKQGRAFALVKGSGMVYAGVGQHTMLAGPLHGSLMQRFNTNGRYQWIAVNLEPYKGQRTHLEFTPADDADFSLIAVVQGNDAPATLPESPNRWLVQETLASGSLQGAAKFLRNNLAAMENGPDTNARLAWLQNWTARNFDLFVNPDSAKGKTLAQVVGPILEQHAKLVAQVQHASRLTPAMQEGSGTDEFVFTRGNPKTPGALVPRRYLEAFSGPDPLKIAAGSGRLELAHLMTDPATTPLIARVYVNRVWYHLFGRGIVASVDNFGVLGDAPTHPELLDHLAARFVKDGWSTKKLIRTLVLTRAYQMSSAPNPKAAEVDPSNHLLHRMRLRRLEGEAIRDSILTVSGRLNAKMYGPSVPVYLTQFQEGRGRPASGPLD
ncbi:MAG TPA: PSD1 and planctomycete cytochrome C domain-containing protein, partial [Gemmataceae bacterium]|nr:PSD1 and planctomycete cytochrome C domain-containing protein [Gemmataceae bacterium]